MLAQAWAGTGTDLGPHTMRSACLRVCYPVNDSTSISTETFANHTVVTWRVTMHVAGAGSMNSELDFHVQNSHMVYSCQLVQHHFTAVAIRC
jgi:hypothetical protein